MRYLYYPLMLLLLALALTEFISVVGLFVANIWHYKWFLGGAAAYLLIRKIGLFARNEQWLQTTSHESTHALVGMLFLHKIHSLQAGDGSGAVYHSGGRFGSLFISLAPYCFPVLSYVLLLLRLLSAEQMLYIFDILIGFTLGFYVVCFATQTRTSQPDIYEQGKLRSWLFILTSWLFSSTLILLSIYKGLLSAITTLFISYYGDLISWWCLLWR